MQKRFLVAILLFLASTFTIGFLHFKISSKDEIAEVLVLQAVVLRQDDRDGLKLTFFCEGVAHTEFLIEPKQVVPARTRLSSQDLTAHLRPHQYPFDDLQASWLAYSGATVAGIKGIDVLKFLSSSKNKWTRSLEKKLLLFAAAGGTGYGLGALLGTYVTPSCAEQGLIFESNAEGFANFYYLGIFRAFSKMIENPPLHMAFSFQTGTSQTEVEAMLRKRTDYLQELTESFENLLDRSGATDTSDFKTAFAHFLAAEIAMRSKTYLPLNQTISDQELVRAMTLYGRDFSREYNELYDISIEALRLVAIASLFASFVICYIALFRYQMTRGKRARLQRIREANQANAPHGRDKNP